MTEIVLNTPETDTPEPNTLDLVVKEHLERDPEYVCAITKLTKAAYHLLLGLSDYAEYPHDPYLRLGSGESTFAMLCAEKGVPIPEWAYHDPEEQDAKGHTVMMIHIMNQNTCLSDKRWRHPVDILSDKGGSVIDFWIVHGESDEIPEWMLESLDNIVDPGFSISINAVDMWIMWRISSTTDIPSRLVKFPADTFTQYRITLAMRWVDVRSTPIPRILEHDPTIKSRDVHGETVLMRIIRSGIHDPFEDFGDLEPWMHSTDLTNRLGDTILTLCLIHTDLAIADWMYPSRSVVNRYGQTILHLFDHKQKIPERLLDLCRDDIHKQDYLGRTPAMFYVEKNHSCNIPQYLMHDDEIVDNEENNLSAYIELYANERIDPDPTVPNSYSY